MIDRLDSSELPASTAAWPGWLPRRVDALATSAGWRVLAFVAIAVADLVVAGIAAAFLGDATGGRLPFLAAIGALIAIQKSLFDRLGRWAVGPRGSLFAWAWLSMLAVPFVLGARYALGEPIVASHFRCGTGQIAFILASPIMIACVGSVGAWWLHALLARRHAWVDRAVVPVVATLLCVAGVTAGLQVVRAAQRPEAESYLAARPMIAHFGPVRTLSDAHPDFVVTDHGIVAHRICSAASQRAECVLRVAREGFGHASEDASSLRIEADTSFAVATVPPAHALVVIDDRSGGGGRRWYLGAVDERTGRPVDIGAMDVASATSAPHGWVFGALGGFAIVALVLATQRRSRARAAKDIASFRDGEASIGGVVNFTDGTPPSSLAGPHGLISGAVVARVAGAADNAHYRADGALGPVEVLRGTREDLRAAAHDMLLGRWMYALAVMLVMSAPVLGFAWSLYSR